jgi:hypothetical protein
MLVPTIVYKILLYGSLALVVVGLAVLRFANEKRPAPPIPPATISRGDSARLKRLALSLCSLLGAMGAAFVAFSLWRSHNDVVIVDEHDGKIDGYRRVWIGARDHFTPTRDGSRYGYTGRDATWIVNSTTRALRLEFVAYGDGTPTPPRPIDPGETLDVTAVDYVGPGDTPDSTMTTEQDNEKSGFRYWLTWD